MKMAIYRICKNTRNYFMLGKLVDHKLSIGLVVLLITVCFYLIKPSSVVNATNKSNANLILLPSVRMTTIYPLQDNSASTTVDNGATQNISHTSRTKPPFYPRNGTGTTVDISKDVDLSLFNSFCNQTKLAIILPVYSATGNIGRRTAIRRTYGQTCAAMKQGCKLFFVIGVDLNRTLLEQVIHEYNTEKDILLVDKVDTYRDLNNKAVAMINWIDQFCGYAKYIVHVIDDVYPNIDMFLQKLESIKERNFVLGSFIHGRVLRDISKWNITTDEYPYSWYPWYAIGTAYAYSMSSNKRLKSAFFTSEYCWIEDVWVTGIVRTKAKVKAIDAHAKFQEYLSRAENLTDNLYFHNVEIDQFYTIFKVSNEV